LSDYRSRLRHLFLDARDNANASPIDNVLSPSLLPASVPPPPSRDSIGPIAPVLFRTLNWRWRVRVSAEVPLAVMRLPVKTVNFGIASRRLDRGQDLG
jgi:hypothetical protein